MKTTLQNFKRLMLTLLISSLLLAGCQKSTEFEYKGKPKETISLERAQALYKAYQPRFDSLTKIRGQEDARYGWHSLDFYKNYIAYLEHESKKVGMEISGLRLYYVAYPENDTISDQAGYQTFMFIPTYYDKESGKHIAFDPLHMEGQGKPIPIHKILVSGAPVGKRTVSLVNYTPVSFTEETASSFADLAQMCKPYCE